MDFNNGDGWDNNNQQNENNSSDVNNSQPGDNSSENYQQSNNNWDNNQQADNSGWDNKQQNGNSWNNQSNNNNWNNGQQNGNSWNNNQNWNNNNNGWNNGGNNNGWNNNNNSWQQTPPPIQRQPVFINGILSRPILKNEARTFLRFRYGTLLAATIIPGLIAFGIGCIPYIGFIFEAIFSPVLFVGGYYLIIGIIRNRNYNVGNMFDVFNYFGNIFGATFTTNLFLFLWSLISVIPLGIYFTVTGISGSILRSLGRLNFGMNFGLPRMIYNMAFSGGFVLMLFLTFVCCIPAIYKSFCWIMVPYILADNPQMTGTQARQISDDMMKGHKWEYFVFLLSYIGWFILSIFTFGILSFLYVNPYLITAQCDYYDNLRMLYEAQHQQPSYTENTTTF